VDLGRAWRLGVVVVVFGLIVLGAFRGSDHDFPFGPFRMYATSGRSTGAVRTAALVGVIDGRPFPIRAESLGIRRAELEGQYDRFRAEPRVLAALARHYQEEQGRSLDELRLVQRVRRVVDGRRVGRSFGEVLVVWRRSP
jgi:hypothetical protein